MALTITLPNDGRITGVGATLQRAQIDFDSSYPTGGEAASAGDFGLGRIDTVMVAGQTNGHSFEWDSTNSKLKVYRLGDIGSTASFAAAALGEVSNTADLSSVTNVEVIVWGG